MPPGQPGAHADPAILLEGVTKRFGTKIAVDNLDLAVPSGSLCGFLGPNGAGKTTTIRMIMAILFPNEGRLEVLGKRSAIESKDRIGYLPEERGVYRTMKVGDFLTYIARLKGVDPSGLSKKIDDWLERLALPGVRKKKCQELSKGMQQKVQFIATVIHEPDLIILDEPFSGLDPVNSRLLRELIYDLHGRGRTIIFSTHVLPAAEQICNRVVLINKGRKVLDGTVAEVRAQFDPRTVVVEPLESGADPRAFEALPGVEGVHAEPNRRGFELYLNESADPQAVMKKAAEVAPMRRVELRAVTLEDVFVELVSESDSEDSEDVRRALHAGGASEQMEAAGA